MHVIAVHTSKGGVGKTTLVVNIAYELAKLNFKVLVVDLDDQANASLSLGVNKADDLDKASNLKEFQEILESFQQRKELIDFLRDGDLPNFNHKDYIVSSPLNNDLKSIINCQGIIDVIPGSYRTQDNTLSNLVSPELRLDIVIENSDISKDYDYVIVDTPPSSTSIAKGGLLAAQYILMPTQLEYLSAFGITSRLKLVQDVQWQSKRHFKKTRSVILGIVPMMTQKRSSINKMVRKLLENQLKGEEIPILSEIHQSDYIKRASHQRKPIDLLAKKHKEAQRVAEEFTNLTQELLNRIETIEND